MTSEIKINLGGIRKSFEKSIKFVSQKKVINIILITLFILLLIGSSFIRLQNLPLLKDQTTNKYIPLALDPFYFLRIAETMQANEGVLPNYDSMRYPSAHVGFSNEILPRVVLFMFNFYSTFDKDVSLQFINVISPVIFFFFGLIVFFFLIFSLTNSKITAFLGSLFLAMLPTYLYRTMAGFSDHESIGMFAFFLALLIYSLSLKFLEKTKENKNFIKSILFGLILGLSSMLSIVSWGGGSTFIFMIIPISFILFWLIKTQNLENISSDNLKKFIYFYLSWFISSILFGTLYGISFSSMVSKVLLGPNSFFTSFTFLFILCEFLIIKNKSKLTFLDEKKLKKYRVLYSVLLAIIIGTGILLVYGNGFELISRIYNQLLQPFGGGRTGVTVAENKQPFLTDWTSQTGKIFFWLFFGGLVSLGINISKYIGRLKNKFFFILFWVLMISGIIFSRISPSSLFNGANFVSRLFYFGGLILFLIYTIWLYFNDNIHIPSQYLILFSWSLLVLISARGAVRLFFLMTPFICFSAGYFIINLFKYLKQSKEELTKMFLIILIIVSLLSGIIAFNNLSNLTIEQAKHTGPSANIQWQNAMAWVRENTPPKSIFIHWWDYGYWVQYLGERPSVTDGGHSIGFCYYLIGRYVLTTSNQETALSFMKTHNVSYLLIDPSELGKYPAYSSIGSDNSGTDRFGQIPITTLNSQQTYENKDGIIRVYNGGFLNDEDIIYGPQEDPVFLPSNKAILNAIIIPVNNNQEVGQPQAVFIYNQEQVTIPIRYLYVEGKLIDYEEGLNAGIRLVPKIDQTKEGLKMDEFGSLIYLSPKTFNSLIGQLYVFENSLEKYNSLILSHTQSEEIVKNLKSNGIDLGEFVYFGGFRGPIKIWKVNYPSNIIGRKEFLRTSGGYAEFDNLKFTI